MSYSVTCLYCAWAHTGGNRNPWSIIWLLLKHDSKVVSDSKTQCFKISWLETPCQWTDVFLSKVLSTKKHPVCLQHHCFQPSSQAQFSLAGRLVRQKGIICVCLCGCWMLLLLGKDCWRAEHSYRVLTIHCKVLAHSCLRWCEIAWQEWLHLLSV